MTLKAVGTTSINGEMGSITITSTGGSVAITTPSSNTINLESIGGGGGSPGGTNGQIQYNNAGAFGGYTYVPLGNGGLGQSMALQSVATAANINALPAGRILLTGSTATNLGGIAAPSPAAGIDTYIFNGSSANVFLLNQSSSATAANRISLAGSAFTLLLFPGMGVHLQYNTSTSRWNVLASSKVYTASSPLGIDGQGSVSITHASTSSDGYINSSEYSNFSNKTQGTAVAGSVPYYLNSNSTPPILYANNNFGYNATKGMLGVGVTNGSQEAVGHFSSTTALTIPDLTSASAVLTQFYALNQPSSYSVTQTTPNLNRTSSASTNVINPDTTNYIAGDVIDYRVTAYNNDSGSNVYSVASTSCTATIIAGTGASDGDSVDINWANDASGLQPVSGYVIQRQVNGGGFNDGVDVGNSGSYHDDDTAWTTVTISPTYPNFLANGSSATFNAYGFSNLNGTDVFSIVYNQVIFSDDNSGNAYLRTHVASPNMTDTVRILNISNGTFADGTNFIENTGTFVSGSTVTPTAYGSQSNGSFWNRTYDFYNYDNSVGVYSANAINQTTTDPNDGNYYYVICSFTGVTSTAKIVRNGTASETSATSPINDDGSTGWTGNTVVTPSGYYAPAGIFDAKNGIGNVVARALENTARFELRDANNTLKGYFQTSSGSQTLNTGASTYLDNGSSLIINTTANLNLQIASSNVLSLGNGQIGFYGATPVAQSTGWSVTAGYTAVKAFNPEATSLTEVAKVLGTLIDNIKPNGLLGS